jgi:rubrerythrin
MIYEDILKEAEQKEIDARDYYRFLAEKSVNQYSTETLTFLAGEEEQHRAYIREFLDAAPEARMTIKVKETEGIEEAIRERVQHLEKIRENIFPHTDEPTIVQKALDMEKNSFEMYKNAEAATEEESAKRLFSILMRAEEKHIALVSALLKKVVWLHEEFPETRPDL